MCISYEAKIMQMMSCPFARRYVFLSFPKGVVSVVSQLTRQPVYTTFVVNCHFAVTSSLQIGDEYFGGIAAFSRTATHHRVAFPPETSSVINIAHHPFRFRQLKYSTDR